MLGSTQQPPDRAVLTSSASNLVGRGEAIPLVVTPAPVHWVAQSGL